VSNIVLGVSASVALYKACDLASKLTQAGHAVRAVLTARAAELVSPQLFEAISGEPAYTNEFDASRRASMDHIDLGRWADLFVVAPASADLIGRLANGLANDLVTTVALAISAERPRLCAPAMNPAMLAQPAVQRNLARLVEDGWRLIEPGTGHHACGDAGRGRLAEPAEIQQCIAEALSV
jgi:phosphopantothenoylcysteine decarboxylase/phosphopantothenate--cysteine ligase